MAAIPDPPALAAETYSDSLKNETVFPSGRCFEFKALGQYVGEGFKFRVMGRCTEENIDADISVAGRGITVGDGDVALDFKVVDGSPRARIGLFVRNTPGRLVAAHVNPGTGEASLFQIVEDNLTTLATRYDLAGRASPTDWNRLALRVSGVDVWLLLNDEPVLYATDVIADAGGIGIQLLREGNPNDTEEVAAVFRDLTLSSIEGADPSRAPVRAGR